jgi:hypothetical protein
MEDKLKELYEIQKIISSLQRQERKIKEELKQEYSKGIDQSFGDYRLKISFRSNGTVVDEAKFHSVYPWHSKQWQSIMEKRNECSIEKEKVMVLSLTKTKDDSGEFQIITRKQA